MVLNHIVFFKMKETAEGRSKEENIALLRQKFQELEKKIPGVLKLETGCNINKEKFDFCLFSVHENEQALEDYLQHPEHLSVRDIVFKVIEYREVVDYKIAY